jgi:hypothetical protein
MHPSNSGSHFHFNFCLDNSKSARVSKSDVDGIAACIACQDGHCLAPLIVAGDDAVLIIGKCQSRQKPCLKHRKSKLTPVVSVAVRYAPLEIYYTVSVC